MDFSNEDLHDLYTGAVKQLSDASREYGEALKKRDEGLPNADLAEKRLGIARESMKMSLDSLETVKNTIRNAKKGH